MSDERTFKRQNITQIINQLPNDPSQITTGTFVDIREPGAVALQGRYLKCGKLYFGFSMRQTLAGAWFTPVTGQTNGTQSEDRIAQQLGITINTTYLTPNPPEGSYTLSYLISNAGWCNFDNGANVNQIIAILAN